MPDEEISVVIPIHCDDSPPPEWAMIELNGNLIAPMEFPTEDASQTVLGGEDRVELGKLVLGSDKIPTMILGSHQLKGKVEQLNEPFTVMEKQYDENKNLESYQVVGVVRQKLMFNQYPKVIMR